MGRELRLNDFNGKPRTLAEFRGKVVLVTFGYTQCPDVCPTTLCRTSTLAMKKLGPDASRVQVLFVTVDPKRDKPELLREYVPAFNPAFIGLYGDEAATKKVESGLQDLRRRACRARRRRPTRSIIRRRPTPTIRRGAFAS